MRGFLPLRARLLPLAAVVLVAFLLSVFTVGDDTRTALAGTLSPAYIVTPSSLTVPVGSRACYAMFPATTPSAYIHVTATTTALTAEVGGSTVTYATHELADVSEWKVGTQNTGPNLDVGGAWCIKGVTETPSPVTITFTLRSDDTNYDGLSVTPLTLTVSAADTKPVVRFLHSQMRVVEDDTGQIYRDSFRRFPINVNELNTKEITVALDIAPAPTSNGHVIWYVPHPDCNSGVAECEFRASTSTNYNYDWVAEGLLARRVYYRAGSNDMQFKFHIRSDDLAESDETVKIYLKNMQFELTTLFTPNTDVCVGSCSSPTEAQQSTVVTIIDDDAGDAAECGYCGREGEVGRLPAPSSDPQDLGKPEDEQPSRNQEQSTPNRAPTVSAPLSDVAMINRGTEQVALYGTFSDADGDALTVTASSSDTAVATASVSPDQSVLTVEGRSRGTATVTVTADDGKGGTVSDSFTVKVKVSPHVSSPLPDVNVLVAGTTTKISLSGVFSDADGDALSITAGSRDEDVATVEVASDGSALTVSGVSGGATTIMVVAQDTDGNQGANSFDVLVAALAPQPELLRPPPAQQQPNRVPTVASPLADVSGLAEGATREVSLSGVFSDADNDALTITASSDYETVATVTVSSDHSTLTVAGVSSGDATITVAAQDPDGAQSTTTFKVEVTDSQPQPEPMEQQPPAQQETQKQETTSTSQPETTPEPESETETQEPETSDAVARYDANGDGSIDLSEYSRAANDYIDGKITYSEMVEIATAYRAS